MEIYLITIITIFSFVIFLAKKLNFYDYPDQRKTHLIPTINLGGIAVIFSLISSIYFFSYSFYLNTIIIFSFYFAVLGLIDDKINLNPFYRIIIQVMIIIYFLNSTDLYISQIFITDQFAIQLGSFSEIFTILCIMVIINSFNYLDGIDLNLIFIVIIFLLIFTIFFNVLQKKELIIFASPIILFSILNSGMLKLPKMFLGDNGSNSIGFLVGSLLLVYNKQAESSFIAQQQIIWITALVVFEFLAINLSRIKRKVSVLQPGNDHIHYILNNFIKRKIYTVISVSLIMIIFFIIGNLILYIDLNKSIIFYLLFFIIYFFLRERMIKY